MKILLSNKRDIIDIVVLPLEFNLILELQNLVSNQNRHKFNFTNQETTTIRELSESCFSQFMKTIGKPQIRQLKEQIIRIFDQEVIFLIKIKILIYPSVFTIDLSTYKITRYRDRDDFSPRYSTHFVVDLLNKRIYPTFIDKNLIFLTLHNFKIFLDEFENQGLINLISNPKYQLH